MKTKKSPINAYSIITIIIIFCIYLFIAIGTVMPNYKQVVYNNWSEYKCNPLIIPMASYYNPSVSTGENFNTCITQLQLVFFKILLAPLYNILEVLQSTLTSLKDAFNSLRQMMSDIRSRIQSIITSIIQKFETIELQLRLFLIKLKSSIGKMEGVMVTTEYTFVIISLALEWIFNVPGVITLVTVTILIILAIMICLFFPIVCAVLAVLAAGVGIAYCFDENTLIKLDNGQTKRISQLKIGENIYLGGRVTGIVRAKHNHDIYSYQDIIVSGEHLVLDDTIWRRVKDCPKATKINYSKEYLYCLLTENNQIVTQNNIVFRDFDEINDMSLNCIFNNAIINSLNQQSLKKILLRRPILEMEIMPCGFSGNTVVKILSSSKCTSKYITDLEIGQILENNSQIVSKVKMCSQNIKMYSYQGLIVSGSNPVFEDNKWIRVYESKKAKLIDFKEKYMYHLGTDNQEILINNCLFRDYLEISRGPLSNMIDNCILCHLNSEVKI